MESLVELVIDMNNWHNLFNNLLLKIKNYNKNIKKFILIAKLYYKITQKINIELNNNFSQEEIENFYLKYNDNINYFLNKLKKVYSDDDIDLYFNIIIHKKVARKLIF
jgi:hypothetical protein